MKLSLCFVVSLFSSLIFCSQALAQSNKQENIPIELRYNIYNRLAGTNISDRIQCGTTAIAHPSLDNIRSSMVNEEIPRASSRTFPRSFGVQSVDQCQVICTLDTSPRDRGTPSVTVGAKSDRFSCGKRKKGSIVTINVVIERASPTDRPKITVQAR